MIKKFLRNIRQKPKAVREQYAFWIACTLTSVVAIVWVTTRISPFESAEVPGEVTVVESDTLSNFMDVAQNKINTARQEVQNILPTADSATTTTASNSPIVTASSSPVVEVATPQATLRQEIRIATTTSSSTN